MVDIERSMEVTEDEEKVRVEAGMRIANLKKGGRRITHPSGFVVIETPAQRAAERVSLVEDIVSATARLTEFDKEEA